jgi:hypothetical protein
VTRSRADHVREGAEAMDRGDFEALERLSDPGAKA